MITIRSPELLEVCGLPRTTLKEWVGQGLVTPDKSGRAGRGLSAEFSVTTAVGLSVALILHRSERGCSPQYLGRVVNAFRSVDESWLAGELRAGRTHFVWVGYGRHPDLPCLKPDPGAGADVAIDVRPIYKRLMETVMGNVLASKC